MFDLWFEVNLMSAQCFDFCKSVVGFHLKNSMNVFNLSGCPLALVAVLSGGVALGQSVGNISGSSPITVDSGVNFGSPFRSAFVFGVGPSSSSISDVTLAFQSTSGLQSGTFSMELWTVSANRPAALISGAAVTGLNYSTTATTSANVVTFGAASLGSIATTTLNANTQYALVFSNNSNSSASLGSYVANTFTSTGGWAYSNCAFDLAGTWQVMSAPVFPWPNLAVGVNTASPAPIPETTGGSIAGLGLVGMGLYQVRRRRQKTVTG